jgi:hypothetical protein
MVLFLSQYISQGLAKGRLFRGTLKESVGSLYMLRPQYSFHLENGLLSRAWWYMSVIPALGRQGKRMRSSRSAWVRKQEKKKRKEKNGFPFDVIGDNLFHNAENFWLLNLI